MPLKDWRAVALQYYRDNREDEFKAIMQEAIVEMGKEDRDKSKLIPSTDEDKALVMTSVVGHLIELINKTDPAQTTRLEQLEQQGIAYINQSYEKGYGVDSTCDVPPPLHTQIPDIHAA